MTVPTMVRPPARPILDALPDWLDSATLGAGVGARFGGTNRYLMWTLRSESGADSLFHNAYSTMWITLVEQGLHGRLYLSAERLVPDGGRRDVTSAGREKMSGAILPVFAERPASFPLVWRCVHQQAYEVSPAEQGIADAERQLRWWQAKEQLDVRWRDGLLHVADLEWGEDTHVYAGRTQSVRVGSFYRSGSWPSVGAVARLVDANDEQVGWLDDSGHCVPLATILQGVG